MSYEAWRREVANGTMADWNEEHNGYDPDPVPASRDPQIRLWDKALKCWVIYHGYLHHDDLSPTGRYSREEVK